MRTRHQKKSWVTLAFMAILCVILLAMLLIWPAAPAKAQNAERPTPEQATLIKDGMVAPDFEVEMFDGSKVKLADLKGKVVLLNFWATWCPPCVKLGPTIEALANEYAGKVGIGKCNVDENSQLTQQFGITGIPAIFFIKGGKVVDQQVGYCEKAVLKAKIDKWK